MLPILLQDVNPDMLVLISTEDGEITGIYAPETIHILEIDWNNISAESTQFRATIDLLSRTPYADQIHYLILTLADLLQEAMATERARPEDEEGR